MKHSLLSATIMFVFTISFLMVEPLGSIYIQLKTIDALNKENSELKSRMVLARHQL